MRILVLRVLHVVFDDVLQPRDDVSQVERLIHDGDEPEHGVDCDLAQGGVFVEVSLQGAPDPIEDFIEDAADRLRLGLGGGLLEGRVGGGVLVEVELERRDMGLHAGDVGLPVGVERPLVQAFSRMGEDHVLGAGNGGAVHMPVLQIDVPERAGLDR
ncbi:hypothetical protein F0U59_23600 [Archangium gephyra]|nr:hypothetical protein F0U59_23600 [Archangium gephyra]